MALIFNEPRSGSVGGCSTLDRVVAGLNITTGSRNFIPFLVLAQSRKISLNDGKIKDRDAKHQHKHSNVLSFVTQHLIG